MPVHHNLPKEGMIYQRDQYAKGGVGRWYWDYRDNIAFSYILPEHKKIVDLGCGEGIALEKLVITFPEKVIIGVDLEWENIEICKRHGLKAVYSNIYTLALPGSYFDACICIDVLEHLDKPIEAIREIYRILKPDGRLILVIPHDRNFFLARLGMFMFKEAFYDPGHARKWNPEEAKNLLRETGFSIKSQKNLPFLCWQLSLHHMVIAEKKQH
jgi:2-polyprenyl-3-methyl-5-hydroxy-6-metoxy-1,4-benzoquinol methylase